MGQRKPNRKNWYSLGLAALLCTALLVITTGTTFARYRAEKERGIYFKERVPDKIHIGTVSVIPAEGEATEEPDATPSTEEVFIANNRLIWKTENQITKLDFAVANGISTSDYSARDQKVRLRMIGNLGNWTGTQPPMLYLSEGDNQKAPIAATIQPIEEGSAIHLMYGDGWVYTFLNEEGEELSWELSGGALSYVTFSVICDGEISEDLTLLQPQAIAEVIQE